jgi:DnaJ domain
VFLWSVTAPFTVMAFGAGAQVGSPDSSGSTVLEQALIEHVCGTMQSAGAPGTDQYHACVSAQLVSMRADFGRDLGRLSTSERRTLDSACSNLQATRGRDAYLACLNGQLAALRARRKRANPPPPAAVELQVAAVDAPSPILAPPVLVASALPPGVWIGAGVFALFFGGGGVILALKSRRAAQRRCRVCGADTPEPGNLCQKCRSEAAEAARSAAAERADQKRAQELAKRRLIENEEEQRRDKVRQAEEAQQRQEQEETLRVRQREEDERRRQEEDARRQREVDVEASVFDPYAVLGVPQGSSKEDVRAAYDAARLKYSPDLVTHLSPEVQEHFKAKAQAVELAYQKATE